jgi:hypothetical protein
LIATRRIRVAPRAIDSSIELVEVVKCGSDIQRRDAVALPPCPFIAAPMKFAVMEPANRDGKSIADLAAHRTLLGKLDVMGV